MSVKKNSKKYKNKYKKNNNKNVKNKKNLIIKESVIIEDKNKLVEKEEDIVKLENDKIDISGNNIVVSNNYYKELILTLTIIFVLGLIVVFFPRIKLVDSDEITIVYNDNYVEPGYKGYVFNKDISKNIDVVSNIDNGIIGEYEVNYYINLFGARVRKTRKVNIVDNISPSIKIDNDVIKVCPNKDVPDIEYEAIDEYDGDITSRVEKIVTDNNILLRVNDLSGNEDNVSIKINRVDDEKPVIKLRGNSVIFLTYGDIYKEPGYTANDNCDGDLTEKVLVNGSVSRNVGTYEIKYEVTDGSGNKTTVKRRVIVGTKINDNGSINKGTIYLTFDDGPNKGTTNKILDILKSEGVKATFFVTGKGPDSLIKRIYDEGHTVALHTDNHNYSYIYSSVDNYFADLNKVSDRVKRITGVESKIIRFPGGSSNTISRNYNKGIMSELTNIVLNQGYRYFDWNVDGMDASSARSSRDVYYNVTSNLSYNKANVVLLHDTKKITVGAVKDIIEFGKEEGYKFSKIDMNTYMVRHKVNN